MNTTAAVRVLLKCLPPGTYYEDDGNGGTKWLGHGPSFLKGYENGMPPYKVVPLKENSSIVEYLARGWGDLIPIGFGVTHQRYQESKRLAYAKFIC